MWWIKWEKEDSTMECAISPNERWRQWWRFNGWSRWRKQRMIRRLRRLYHSMHFANLKGEMQWNLASFNAVDKILEERRFNSMILPYRYQQIFFQYTCHTERASPSSGRWKLRSKLLSMASIWVSYWNLLKLHRCVVNRNVTSKGPWISIGIFSGDRFPVVLP